MTARQMADRLARAKSLAQPVLEDWHDEAEGLGDLEHAIELLGKCEAALDAVADTWGEAA